MYRRRHTWGVGIVGPLVRKPPYGIILWNEAHYGKKIIPIRIAAAVGVGTVLFFVLMRFVTIPSGVPNTFLNLSAAIVTVFAAIFGPITGFLLSFIGHALTDLTFGKIW
ncbi:MAG: ECF transporter S component [Treponema sp.]|nr:ECF transporter S component [Treponema sp.]